VAIVLTNKDTSPRTVAVVVRGYAPATSIVSRIQLAGTGASDPAPQRSSLPSLSIGRGQLRITLPPVSVTVLRLTGQRG
jgi:hypothetical protein